MDNTGVIYILTNPSFLEYVKIGYADSIDKRLQQLNRSECIPFAFHVYVTYEVNSRLGDNKNYTKYTYDITEGTTNLTSTNYSFRATERGKITQVGWVTRHDVCDITNDTSFHDLTNPSAAGYRSFTGSFTVT